MSGTREGGMKARQTNIKLHGKDFYQNIGRKGGRKGHTGGFASNPALARLAGAKGGRTSIRGVSTQRLISGDYDQQIFRLLHDCMSNLPKLYSKISKTKIHRYPIFKIGKLTNPYDMYVDFLSVSKGSDEIYNKMITACAYAYLLKNNDSKTTEQERAANAILCMSRYIVNKKVVDDEINVPSPCAIRRYLNTYREFFDEVD